MLKSENQKLKLRTMTKITSQNTSDSALAGKAGNMARRLTRLTIGLMALIAWTGAVQAQPINVPNGSFESPTPPPGFPATPQVDNWLKSPQPPEIQLPGAITWEQMTGVFPNTPSGSADHIDNVDGNQAAYMFSIPGIALYQQLNSVFEVGNSYSLTLGILGGGGIPEGSSFLMSLYYLNGANPVTVGATPITYSAAGFPNPTHLYDFSVNIGAVQASDAWAGKNIGIQLLSTFGTGAGYWDVDNVQLAVVPEPGTISLLALGAGGLLLARWRARRRK